MAYEMIWEEKGVLKRFYDRCSMLEVFHATVEGEGDERFDSLRYAINDFLDCTEFVFDQRLGEEMEAIDGAAAIANSNIKIAVVAAMPAIIAAAKVYASSTLHPYPVRIFSTREEARRWIAGDAR